ncbi:FAD-binding oxidoreductase [Plantactinospora soyae]|uniref:FAD/FMN-containing dehydrogenase n=1 Tax=Plantactinospora soyae TaxID=1544732 RepID=A0A927MFN2_9ACTN|nr:FAD-binding protein [Plantactinospora soyae]MBE1490823.1 FAD/FMN-containing dehydrogenase [Plantactinospora soyae]
MADVRGLRAQLRGPVLEPGDPGFADEVAGYNAFAKNRPVVAIGAERVEDVLAAVAYATRHDLPVRVQGTGHGIGSGFTDGVLITTGRMRDLVIDPAAATAHVGAGLAWADLMPAVAEHGLAGITGSSPGVGVVGWLLGGGLSPVGRTFGFGSDRLIGLDIVTCDGTVQHVTQESQPDLFWALRGGRAGLGIVTSVDLDLVPLRSLYGGGLYFDADLAEVALRTWADWAASLSEDTTTSVALLRLADQPVVPPEIRNRFVVHIRVAHIGEDASGEAIVAPLRAIGEPLLGTIGRMPYTAIGTIHNDPPDPLPIWLTSGQLREFPADAAAAVLATAGAASGVPLMEVEIRQLGGVMAATPRLADAISGRDAGYVVIIAGVPEPDLFGTEIPAAAARVLDALSPWTLRGPQANFSNDVNDGATMTSTWEEAIRRRLVQIKTSYDPADVFRFGAHRPGPVSG